MSAEIKHSWYQHEPVTNMYRVQYWTGSGSNKSNTWQVFEDYGDLPTGHDLAFKAAKKLAELFSRVEVHHIREGQPTTVTTVNP